MINIVKNLEFDRLNHKIVLFLNEKQVKVCNQGILLAISDEWNSDNNKKKNLNDMESP